MVKNVKSQILRNGELVERTKGPIIMDDSIALEIALGDKNKYVFVVDQSKNISVLKPVRTISRSGENVYHIDVKTHHWNIGEDEFIYTRYPENGLRVLERHGSRILITEFSVISQHGQLFMVEQPTHYEEIAREGTRILVPTLNWKALDDLLTEDVKGGAEHRLDIDPTRLRKPADVPAKKHALIPELGNKQGCVLWYNAAMGSGCILTKSGQAKIWWPNTPINPETGMRTLSEGDIVQYGRLKEIDRPNTKFRLEIVGEVKVIKLPKEEKQDLPLKTESSKPLPEKSTGATA